MPTATPEPREILFFGGHHWARGPWFRKQQFARRLAARGHHVWYVEASVSVLRRQAADQNLPFRTTYHPAETGVTVVTPAALLPFPTHPGSRWLSDSGLAASLARRVRRPIVWFNTLSIAAVLPALRPAFTLFDLCDDLPLYQALAGNRRGEERERRSLVTAFRRADAVIASARRLEEKYGRLARRPFLHVPNGHAIEERDGGPPVPPELRAAPHPIIGFAGTLFRFLDAALIEGLVTARPEWTFAFVGPREADFPIETLMRHPNALVLGPRDRAEVPRYLAAFDAAISPFRRHEVNDSVVPVKVFEYLAAGKKVVSTRMASLEAEPIARHIHFASDLDGFLTALDAHVASGCPRYAVPAETLRAYHWDNLFTSLLDQLRAAHGVEL